MCEMKLLLLCHFIEKMNENEKLSIEFVSIDFIYLFLHKTSARFMWETDNKFNFLFLRIPCILNLLALPVNHFLCLCCLYSIQTRKRNNYNHTECLRLQHLKYTTFSYFLAANIQCSEGADWMWINVFITLFFKLKFEKKTKKKNYIYNF